MLKIILNLAGPYISVMLPYFIIFVLFCVTQPHTSVSYQDTHWPRNANYDTGPAWSHSVCKGNRQSPINIIKQNVTNDNQVVISLHNYNTNVSANVSKEHQMAYFTVDHKTDVRLIINNNSCVESEYKLHGFHFHWSCTEHLIDGKRYDLELHFVHYNRQFGSFQEAMLIDGGLSVLAVLFRLTNYENPALNVIFDMLRSGSTYRNAEKRPLLYSDLLPLYNFSLYQYNGSLTTVPCLETVCWNVASELNYLSYRQMSEFKSLHVPSVTNNCRSLQAPNGRKVHNVTMEMTTDGVSILHPQLIPHTITIFILIYLQRSIFSMWR